MRHRIKLKKINRTSAHRKAMFANMASSLIEHEQIKTTLVKAKALRPYVEKLVTKAKVGNLSARRKIISLIKSDDMASKLIGVLAERYKKRPGGYTRIVKAGYRYGDRAPIAYIEFVDRDLEAKGKKQLEQKEKSIALEKESNIEEKK